MSFFYFIFYFFRSLYTTAATTLSVRLCLTELLNPTRKVRFYRTNTHTFLLLFCHYYYTIITWQWGSYSSHRRDTLAQKCSLFILFFPFPLFSLSPLCTQISTKQSIKCDSRSGRNGRQLHLVLSDLLFFTLFASSLSSLLAEIFFWFFLSFSVAFFFFSALFSFSAFLFTWLEESSISGGDNCIRFPLPPSLSSSQFN